MRELREDVLVAAVEERVLLARADAAGTFGVFAVNASATSMPATMRPKGVNGSLSWVAELSRRLMNTCVVRPFGTAKANATVPLTFDCLNGIVGNVRVRHAFAIAGIAVDAELRPRPA